MQLTININQREAIRNGFDAQNDYVNTDVDPAKLTPLARDWLSRCWRSYSRLPGISLSHPQPSESMILEAIERTAYEEKEKADADLESDRSRILSRDATMLVESKRSEGSFFEYKVITIKLASETSREMPEYQAWNKEVERENERRKQLSISTEREYLEKRASLLEKEEAEKLAFVLKYADQLQKIRAQKGIIDERNLKSAIRAQLLASYEGSVDSSYNEPLYHRLANVPDSEFILVAEALEKYTDRAKQLGEKDEVRLFTAVPETEDKQELDDDDDESTRRIMIEILRTKYGVSASVEVIVC